MQSADRPQFYTPDEAITDYLGPKFSRHNVYGAMKSGKLKHLKVGRRILLRKEDIDSWLDSLTAQAG